MTLFSIATAAMILLASIYASYMLQTEEDINASSIQLAEDRDYSYALLVSSQYACIHAIDSFLQSNNNFSLSSDIKSNMTSSCISGVKTLAFSSDVTAKIRSVNADIYSYQFGDIIKLRLVLTVSSSLATISQSNSIELNCQYTINDAQQEMKNIESQLKDGTLQPVNQTIYYPYWNITVLTNTVLTNNSSSTIILLRGVEQLCLSRSSNFYTIYDEVRL